MNLSSDEVHVWRIQLDRDLSELSKISAVLPKNDIERAMGLRTEEMRNRWIVSRGALRSILAGYVQRNAIDLIFSEGPHGKPELVDSEKNVFFNLTHTSNLAFVIAARDHRVGIDAEWIRADVEIEKLSFRFFAVEETEEILSLSGDPRLQAFFSCWTRKEAFAKGLGMGLTIPLNQYRVSVRADEPARLISTAWSEKGPWALIDISEQDVAAAAAIEMDQPVLRRFEFSF